MVLQFGDVVLAHPQFEESEERLAPEDLHFSSRASKNGEQRLSEREHGKSTQEEPRWHDDVGDEDIPDCATDDAPQTLHPHGASDESSSLPSKVPLEEDYTDQSSESEYSDRPLLSLCLRTRIRR